MRPLLLWLLSALLLATPAQAERVAQTRAPIRSVAGAKRFIAKVLQRERGFYRPGVGYDGATGMTFDGHAIDFVTGELTGAPRPISAASKESLHLALLSKAIAGDVDAGKLVAKRSAIEVLTKKIASYEAFDREYPGYGGFLPWYKIDGGKVSPAADWTDRVPGLDNGQLAWSLYVTANALRDAGHIALAARYQAHLDKMRRNVVRMFYDPTAKKIRAEATLDRGNGVEPERNRYVNRRKDYFLDDGYEGLLLCHFADLMGDWSAHPDGKEAVFRTPRRVPITMRTGQGAVTSAKGAWFSSHEDWGYLVLPFRDVPIADAVFKNGQRARTAWSAQHGWTGLLAATHEPVAGNVLGGYINALGVTPLGTLPTTGKPIFAPYAAFPLALVDRPLFASWMSSMLSVPGMFGKYGIVESYSEDGKRAPLLTWDGKALPMIAWMGGIEKEVARLLKRDGLYDQFRMRVEHDFARFGGTARGEHVDYALPPQ